MNAAEAVEIAQRIKPCTPRATARGKLVRCPCPGHEDVHPSCEIFDGDDHEFRATCYVGCDWQAVKDALREAAGESPFGGRSNGNTAHAGNENGKRTKAEVIAQYVYENEENQPLFRVNRMNDKRFFQDRWTGSEWVKGLGDTRRVLFRLPELQEAIPEDKIVWVLEGEKDVLRAVSEGLTATCTPGSKWRPEFAEHFQDARVAIVPDNDVPGQKLVLQIAEGLHSVAREIRLLEPLGDAKGYDLSDFLDEGGTVDELWQRYEATPSWLPGRDAEPEVECNDDAFSDDPRLVVSADPLRLAEYFRDAWHRDAKGRITLRRWRGEWWAYSGSCYAKVEPDALRAEIYSFLDGLTIAGEGESKPLKVTARLVNEVEKALPSRGTLIDIPEAPAWLERRNNEPPADEILSCANGLLHVPTRKLYPASPLFFTVNASTFDYDPAAPTPENWSRFIYKDLFESDREAADTIQEMIGYFLTADTSQHKCFLFVGPVRSGKGTAARIVTRLIGEGNVCNPTLAALCGPFGLQPMLHKSLAVVSDARLSRRQDSAVVAERLLSISGEDYQTIERKYNTAVHTKLNTRFLLLSNELPRIADASRALASRFIIIPFTKSFYGREDHGLENRLVPEMPGILNWALDGWQRLHDRGHFVQPESGKEAIQVLEDLGSPVGAFVREICEVGPGLAIRVTPLYSRWCQWCKETGREHTGTEQTFGRDLRAVVPGLKMSRPRINGKPRRTYEGIGIGDGNS